MTSDTSWDKLSVAEQIQICFPSEPDLANASEATLIELVEKYYMEQSCADMALGELIRRRHPRSEEFCNYHFYAERADKWLRAGALESLISLNPIDGFNKAMPLIDAEDQLVLEVVVPALIYSQDEPLAEEIRRHPIVPLVKRRIAQLGQDKVEDADGFAERFGNV
jgi:hypothetical protein